MTEYEPREFTITGTVSAPESVGARELAESLKRGLEQSARGATVDLGDFTKYATDDAEDEGGCPCDRCGKHHPAATCAEPEDKDDLYVEPEPLKEGDAVLVWAMVTDPKPGEFGLTSVRLRGDDEDVYAYPGHVVRPDAGQVPPWVKPARCTSVHMPGARSFTLHWCEDTEGHAGDHEAGFTTWTDAEAHGRVEVSS